LNKLKHAISITVGVPVGVVINWYYLF